MKIAIFGGSGFVGNYLIKELLNNKYIPTVLQRKKTINKLDVSKQCEIIYGNIEDEISIEKALEGVHGIIYNIGIIRQFLNKNITFQRLHYEGFKRVLKIAKKNNIKRVILMSANGASTTGTEYQTTKWKAEQELINSQFDWTIFRPSLIFGKPLNKQQPEFCTQLKRNMINLPIPAPLFYNGIFPIKTGNFELSPIHVENIASFFVKSLKMDSTINKIYELGGENKFTWKEIINKIANSCGRNKFKIPVPAFGIKIVASFFDRYEWFPITKDQIIMLLEGNIVNKLYFKEFDITPIEFNNNSLKYLKN